MSTVDLIKRSKELEESSLDFPQGKKDVVTITLFALLVYTFVVVILKVD